MNKKLHFKSLLLMVAMLFGASSAWADNLIFDFESDEAHRPSGSNNSYTGTNEYEQNDVAISLTYADAVITGTPLNGNANILGRIAKNTTNSPVVLLSSIPIEEGKKITQISFLTKGNTAMKMEVEYTTDESTWNNLLTVNSMPSDKTTKTITNLDISGSSSFDLRFKVSVPSKTTSNRDFQLDDIIITYTDASSSKTPTSLEWSEETYSFNLGDTYTLPTLTATPADIESKVTYESSNKDVATVAADGTVSIIGVGSTTITASYEGDDIFEAATNASYTLTVNPAVVTYTSMEALQRAVASLEEQKPISATITFTDILVSHVDGNSAYITDGDKGALIYTKNHGLKVGQVLNGTINCKLQKYTGQTEITEFTSAGLTITDGSLSALEKTPGDITAANQSLLVTLKEVVYDADKTMLTDGSNSIAFFDKFKTNVKLVGGKPYDITGIVIVNNTTVEVCPRTADDVKEAVSEKAEPTSVWKSNGEEVSAICILKSKSISVSFDTNSTATASFESSNTEVATVDNDGKVTLTGTVGVAVITASTEGNNEFLPSSATLSILVAEAEPEDAVFDFSLFQDYGSGMTPTSNSNDPFVYDEKTWTAGNITMKTNGKVRWYIGTSNGNTTYTLRLHGKTEPYSYMTISAPDGYVITAISGLGGALKASTGENKSGKWSGMAQEITFTYENTSNSANMSRIKVTYTKPEFAMTMNGDFTTFCANMSIDFSTSGIKAYTAKVNNGIVKLTEVESGNIPAGKGVILKGDAGNHDVKVIESAAALSGTNELTGVIEDTEIPWSVEVSETTTKYNYILQSGEFKKATGAILRAGKAYLSTKYDVTATGARELKIVVEGETTGIKAIETASDQNVYDLQGRKVAVPSKGLYIINGKKMIVK